MIGHSHDCLKCGSHFSAGCPCVDEPLKAEDIVPGSIIRLNLPAIPESDMWLQIVGVTKNCVIVANTAMTLSRVAFTELLNGHWEIKCPGESWKPCRQPYPSEIKKNRKHPAAFWALFHYLWGKSKDGAYDKEAWISLQTLAQIHGIK